MWYLRSFPAERGFIQLAFREEYPDYYGFLGRPERNGFSIEEYLANFGISHELSPGTLEVQQAQIQTGGYTKKYLKYKSKYIALKN